MKGNRGQLFFAAGESKRDRLVYIYIIDWDFECTSLKNKIVK